MTNLLCTTRNHVIKLNLNFKNWKLYQKYWSRYLNSDYRINCHLKLFTVYVILCRICIFNWKFPTQHAAGRVDGWWRLGVETSILCARASRSRFLWRHNSPVCRAFFIFVLRHWLMDVSYFGSALICTLLILLVTPTLQDGEYEEWSSKRELSCRVSLVYFLFCTLQDAKAHSWLGTPRQHIKHLHSQGE